jgi:hypothetical protein
VDYRDGVDEAVGGQRRVSATTGQAEQVLNLVPLFRTATWGADEQRTGDMWNSNSLISWLLARSGHDMSTIHPPAGGRAPGWRAGLVVASRELNVGLGEDVSTAAAGRSAFGDRAECEAGIG